MTVGGSNYQRQEEGLLLRGRQLQVLVTARGHHLSSRDCPALTYRINSYLHLPTRTFPHAVPSVHTLVRDRFYLDPSLTKAKFSLALPFVLCLLYIISLVLIR